LNTNDFHAGRGRRFEFRCAGAAGEVDGHHLRVQGALETCVQGAREFMISGEPFNGARRIRGDRAKSLGPTGHLLTLIGVAVP
jgi:hypothetical protein